MLGDVNKRFVFKSLLTMPNIVLPLHLKQTFLPIIWIFTEGEGDRIKSRLPSKIFFYFKMTKEKFICKIQSQKVYDWLLPLFHPITEYQDWRAALWLVDRNAFFVHIFFEFGFLDFGCLQIKMTINLNIFYHDIWKKKIFLWKFVLKYIGKPYFLK